MESAIQKVNTSDAGLGKKMKTYGIVYVIINIIMFFVTLILSFEFMSNLTAIDDLNQVNPIFVDYIESLAIWSIISTSLLFILTIWFTFGLRALSKITHWNPAILRKAFGILIIGYICQFGIGIYSVFNLFSIADIISTTIIDWSNSAVLNSVISQINNSAIPVTILGLLFDGVIFFGYLTLKKWGEGLAEYIPAFSPKNNIERAFNLIVIGSGLTILGELISLIPDIDIGGWISLAAMILMVVGFIRAGNLLKGGIPTIPAVRPIVYSSYQQYPPSSMSPGHQPQTNQSPTTTQPSFNPPTMNPPETQYPTSQFRICPVCGQADIPPDAKFCHACGRIM